MEFINEIYINQLLDDENLFNEDLQKDIINKGSEASGLTLKEAAALLNINSSELPEELFHTAKSVEEKTCGNRLVLFAPLYIINLCVNNCLIFLRMKLKKSEGFCLKMNLGRLKALQKKN